MTLEEFVNEVLKTTAHECCLSISNDAASYWTIVAESTNYLESEFVTDLPYDGEQDMSPEAWEEAMNLVAKLTEQLAHHNIKVYFDWISENKRKFLALQKKHDPWRSQDD